METITVKTPVGEALLKIIDAGDRTFASAASSTACHNCAVFN